MSLGIVIPLKSKAISRNWDATSSALQSTLDSILNQSDTNFVVCVAGHDKPEFMSDERYSRIVFEQVDFPVPDRSAPNFSHQDLLNDKNKKILAAMLAIRSEPIDYWFQLDSDDLIHRDFCKTVATNVNGAGAIIDGGYLYFASANRLIPTSEMAVYCGSTSILSNELLTLPASIEAYEETDFIWNRTPHMKMHQYFDQYCKGDYSTLTTPLLIYLLASGDNISDKWRDTHLAKFKAWLKPYIKGKKPNQSLKEAFSLSS